MSESLEHEIRTLRAHFWSDRDPDGRAFAPLADAYLRKGELDEALALVEEGTRRLPDYATGHLIAARVHRGRGDRSAARAALDQLLDLDPGNAPGLRLLGELAEEAGGVEEAVAAFRGALARDPGYGDLEGRIARLLTPGVEEKAELAAPEPEEAPGAPDEPERPHLTRTMAELYVRQGLLDRAVEVYRALAERAPEDDELRARVDELTGRLELEGPAWVEAVERSGSDASGEGDEDDPSGKAPQWAGGTEDARPAGETPFAWVDADEDEDGEEEGGPSIGQYFEDLLAWEPGAVPIESLAPPREEEDFQAWLRSRDP